MLHGVHWYPCFPIQNFGHALVIVLFLIAVLLGCIPLHLSHLVICTCVRQPCCSKYMLHTNLVNTDRIILIYVHQPIPVTERSKAWVCSRSLDGIAGLNPAGAWTSVSWEYCMLSGRGLCVQLITSPEESYWVWWVWEWSWTLDNEEAQVNKGGCTMKKKK